MNQLQVNQIVCLEQDNFCLYCEVIQLIPQRKYCWVRPLLLVFFNSSFSTADRAIALNNSSDLLLPESLFRAAFDTEMLNVLSLLPELETNSETNYQVQQELSGCIQKVWQANRNLFDTV
ncbi:hypothetical protein Sta7437_3283 [Stanieria cyanosphaera PCC 7437]|uniref:Uncharacterized protein n=1 Tax=Stanieria cyanosphaera (strain ATCC 29371 / PCC 7437) TaxID=111780 RepID=K9XW25_STAC7|nr:hypothetical protein [Stanieria cyanosphaera]AFZ36790.1 hypothetical protein Sta7437_3283 [Stanieria cyanosphaera PCC 7437]